MQQKSESSARSGVSRILVSGADAETFLQGQLTQDLRRLKPDEPLLAGYCSPKGRLLAVMRLQRSEGGIALDLHRSVAETVLKRLKMYVLRSKLNLADAGIVVPEAEDERWRRQQIQTGVPTIFPATQDRFVPQMCNLDALGAISYDKGCYTGQEIVARLHYLGQLKRRMYRARLKAPAQAQAGEAVYAAKNDQQPVGEIVDAIDDAALVVLQISHAAGELRLRAPDGPALRELTALVASA